MSDEKLASRDLIERDAAIAAIVKEGWAKDSTPCAILRRIPAATLSGTKPSIDWSHVAPEFVALARDSGGLALSHTSYTPGTCGWKDSLVMRPGYKGE